MDSLSPMRKYCIENGFKPQKSAYFGRTFIALADEGSEKQRLRVLLHNGAPVKRSSRK